MHAGVHRHGSLVKGGLLFLGGHCCILGSWGFVPFLFTVEQVFVEWCVAGAKLK